MAANKRMLSKDLILTNKFLAMNANTRSLYLLLTLSADDDGFIEPHICMQLNKSNTNNLIELAKNDFITVFQKYKRGDEYITVICQTDEHIENINLDKVYVVSISDWYLSNNIRKDIYQETDFIEETKYLYLDSKGKITSKNKENTYISIYDMKNMIKGEPLSQKKIKSIYKDMYNNNTLKLVDATTKKLECQNLNSYGALNNIYLTDDEYISLKERYKGADKLIDKVSSIIENRQNKSEIKSYFAYITKVAIEDNWEINEIIKEKEIASKKEMANKLLEKDYELERKREYEKQIELYMENNKVGRDEAISEINKQNEIVQLSTYLRTGFIFGRSKEYFDDLIKKHKNEPLIAPILRSKGLI